MKLLILRFYNHIKIIELFVKHFLLLLSKMYFCPFCFESCVTIKSLKAHCKLKHYTKLYSSFKCCQKPCPRTFSNSYTFFKHLSRSHAERNSNIIDTSDTNTKIKKILKLTKVLT